MTSNEPNPTNTASDSSVSPRQVVRNPEERGRREVETNEIIDEMMRRLTPILMDKISQMITDVMACKCCS
jgi:hypothetical protein